MKKTQWIAVLCFGLLMLGLGASDALRGIFSPIFQQRYALDESQLSQLITVSYIGNLLFLSIGGKLMDTLGRKTVMISMLAIWGFSMLLNAMTDSYLMVLISVFLALGASTLLNTSVNLSTPLISAQYAGLLVNIFFFIQGIGTSGSQLVLGRYGFSYGGWRTISMLLLGIAVISLVLFLFTPVKNKTPQIHTHAAEQDVDSAMPSKAVFWMFAAMMGCYFIAEHSVMNRLMSYCLNEFQMESSQASLSLSLFWAGMTIGRLVFAPVVQKWGAKRSIAVFGGIGTVLFTVGCILGQAGVFLLGISGLAISILYPTMLLFLQQLYPVHCVAAKTGVIISVATIADITFNAGFGFVLSAVGYRVGFLLLPCFLIVFYVLYHVIGKMTQKQLKN